MICPTILLAISAPFGFPAQKINSNNGLSVEVLSVLELAKNRLPNNLFAFWFMAVSQLFLCVCNVRPDPSSFATLVIYLSKLIQVNLLLS